MVTLSPCLRRQTSDVTFCVTRNTSCWNSISKKLKLSHYTPRRRLGERRYSSYSFLTSALDGVSGQRHAPAAIYPRGKDSRYPLYRRLGGPQSRSGYSWNALFIISSLSVKLDQITFHRLSTVNLQSDSLSGCPEITLYHAIIYRCKQNLVSTEVGK
jgi:hypothetical protein